MRLQMARCPNCGKEIQTPSKEWDLAKFMLSNTSAVEKNSVITKRKFRTDMLVACYTIPPFFYFYCFHPNPKFTSLISTRFET